MVAVVDAAGEPVYATPVSEDVPVLTAFPALTAPLNGLRQLSE